MKCKYIYHFYQTIGCTYNLIGNVILDKNDNITETSEIHKQWAKQVNIIVQVELILKLWQISHVNQMHETTIFRGIKKQQ